LAVKDLYDKACEAANKGNYDYAIELYREVLRIEPEYPGARVLLRGTERRRLREMGSSVTTLTHRAGGAWHFLKAQLQFGNPRRRLESWEDFLEHAPSSTLGLLMAAKTARKAGYADTAATILKDLLTVRPDNKTALRVLGDTLEEAGQIKEALKFLRRLATLIPTDRNLNHRVKNLEAQAHMQETHMEEAESFRDMVRDKDFAEVAEKRFETLDQRTVRMVEEARRDLEQDPTNITKLIRLAEIYEEQGALDNALRLLTDAYKQSPSTFEFRSRLGDLQLRISDRILERITASLQKDQADPELIEKERKLRLKRRQFATREYTWRVQQHPTDPQLQFQLGEALLENGETDGAIFRFQQSAKDPRLEIGAARMLGRCFAAKGQYDLAAEQYRRAIARHKLFDETGMELQYLLAGALENMGKSEEALGIYKKLYSSDISFRDVAQKVEALSK